jgi:hypothetical protein
MNNLQRRLTGSALMIGGVLAIVGYLAVGIVVGGSSDARFTDPNWQPLYAIALAGGILTVMGFPAVLTVQNGRSPRLTTIGYAGTLAALLMLNLGEGVIEGFVKPYLVTHGGIPNPEPAGFAAWEMVGLVCMLGLICLGVAILRARTMPRWVGVALIVSPFLSFALGGAPTPLPELADICASLALIAIGWRAAVPSPALPSRPSRRARLRPDTAESVS